MELQVVDELVVIVGQRRYSTSTYLAKYRNYLLTTYKLRFKVPHVLACNPDFSRGVKYCCVQRAGSTRQWFALFCSTVTKHGLYK